MADENGAAPAVNRTVRVFVAGRVQGVAYRAWTERTAKGLGLAGWVRNRSNGAVEALFHGPSAQVEEMLKRCERGPVAARVSDVRAIEESGEALAGFSILPTA